MRPARRAVRSSSAARSHDASGRRFTILASEFHPAIARALIDGASGVLQRHGASAGAITVVRVPGAFELPVVAARLAAASPVPDAIIAVGCLIRGETPQYEVIAHAVADGLSHVSVTTGVPVTFGIIVADTLAQAKARAGGRVGNRGVEAALAALAVLRLLRRVEHASP